jgi:acetyltransferase-like isoleucine patch superfamily enzyme
MARLYRQALDANHQVSLDSLGYLGHNTRIDSKVCIWGAPNCSIGSNVQINGYTFLYAGGGIAIGDYAMIASNVVITSVTHPTDSSRSLRKNHRRKHVFPRQKLISCLFQLSAQFTRLNEAHLGSF